MELWLQQATLVESPGPSWQGLSKNLLLLVHSVIAPALVFEWGGREKER